jgi:hypothetical protein
MSWPLSVCPISLERDDIGEEPAFDLFDIDDLKQLIAVGDETPDWQIELYLKAAIEWAEGAMQRSVIEKPYKWILKDFPLCAYQEIRLPMGRTQSVDLIEYSLSGTQTQIASGSFQEDLTGESGGRIRPLRGQSWPTADIEDIRPVTIYFTAGWTSADAVPADIRHAIAFAVDDALEIRGSADIATGGANFQTRESLISAWRLPRFY